MILPEVGYDRSAEGWGSTFFYMSAQPTPPMSTKASVASSKWSEKLNLFFRPKRTISRNEVLKVFVNKCSTKEDYLQCSLLTQNVSKFGSKSSIEKAVYLRCNWLINFLFKLCVYVVQSKSNATDEIGKKLLLKHKHVFSRNFPHIYSRSEHTFRWAPTSAGSRRRPGLRS